MTLAPVSSGPAPPVSRSTRAYWSGKPVNNPLSMVTAVQLFTNMSKDSVSDGCETGTVKDCSNALVPGAEMAKNVPDAGPGSGWPDGDVVPEATVSEKKEGAVLHPMRLPVSNPPLVISCVGAAFTMVGASLAPVTVTATVWVLKSFCASWTCTV